MNRTLNYTLIIVCFLSIIIVLFEYINPYFWYDEAGQFWISQGLNHYSEPYSVRGSIIDVVNNNRDYNKDPGGFSILLYLWQSISTNYVFLRLLPTIFFVAFSIILFFLANHELDSKSLSCLIATTPFVLPIFSNHVSELRAYSMELIGTMLSIWLFIKNRERWNYSFLLTFLFVQLFFCTSRYGYIIFSFSYSIRITYSIYKGNELSKFALKSFVYWTPYIIAIYFIYVNMTVFQNDSIDKLSYVRYIDATPLLLLSPFSIMFYLAVLSLIIKRKKQHKVSELQKAACYISTFFFVLSAFGKYPWCMHRTISAFSLLVFFWGIELIIYIRKYSYRTILIISIISLVAYLPIWYRFINISRRMQTGDQIKEYLQFVKNNSFNKAYVSLHLNPVLRYQYEYGALSYRKNRDEYPNRFILEKGPKHSNGKFQSHKESIDNEVVDVVWSIEKNIPSYLNPIPGYKNFYRINKGH